MTGTYLYINPVDVRVDRYSEQQRRSGGFGGVTPSVVYSGPADSAVGGLNMQVRQEDVGPATVTTYDRFYVFAAPAPALREGDHIVETTTGFESLVDFIWDFGVNVQVRAKRGNVHGG